ncbi:DNA-binding response regulator [Oceanisphaera profunda]|uniref:DNA-binding response regulator n=1 Tax=Oceanisphaera profunda TaxID=1416627 RepID=A0A1Y0D3D5_9GAMM|nr:response regulator transcription factor [Oceanisphaera profunda]ART81727.1 DNA-binding response regulator [Oceanisphaera profunda]
MRILLIEDTVALGEAIREQIADDGHAVDWVRLLKEARACVLTTRYDLILLDLMLPDGRGLDFLQQQRGAGNSTPVIILTALDQITDRINGLNAGADDYLVKPFDLNELSARLAAVARRYHGNPNPVLNICGLEVDLVSHSVHKNGQMLDLTAREWAVFEALLQRPGTLLSKAQLEDHLYEFGAEIESNTIEVYVSRLRKRLGREVIETVRGMGYRLALS